MKTIPLIFGFLVTLVGIGCGPDLGACPDAATYQAAFTAQGIHPGQQVINGSCAGGTCHSASATGGLRLGAPATLNFDLLGPSPAVVAVGAENARNWADDMWGEVEEGSMPPEGTRPPLSDQDKEAARVFLACGAQRLDPMVVTPPTGTDPFLAAHPTLDTSCMGCHDSTLAAMAGGGFSMGTTGDACSMYTALVTTQATCDATRSIVVPNDAAQSLLISKLDGVNLNMCGSLMPFGTQPANTFAMQQPTVVESLRTWITMGALKPSTCP